MSKVIKYRPVLTAEQIEHILNLARLDLIHSHQIGADTSTSTSIIATLAPFQAKIENAGLVPAYTTAPRTTLLEQLGEKESVDNSTREAYWHQCYLKYCSTPNFCSIAEIQAAREHRYLNDLMAPEEMEAFEKAAFASNYN